jgi:hypothetical protein
VADDHALLAAADAAVEHQGVFERGDVGFAQVRPEAQIAQLLCTVLGEGDFAAVEGWFLHGGQGLLFELSDAQAAATQGARQAQAGRPGPDEDEVEVHGGAA